MTFRSIDPATEEIIAEYASHSAAEVEQRLASASQAQHSWARRDVAERSLIIRKVAERLRNRAEEAALMITCEMGKPLSQSRAEVEKCALALDFMAGHALRELQDENVATEHASSVVRFAPLGLVLCIMPWNFPLWQFFRFAAPTLMAGNGILLKHAPTTWGCAELSVEICVEGGVPLGLVDTVRVDVPDVEGIIADARIQAVTFTGSTVGGSAVGALAGKYVKKSVLELGGSDAYVVLADANVERAASVCVQQRCSNAGQSCIAAKRFIVHRDVADRFQDIAMQRLGEYVIGDPRNAATTMGPLARKDLKDLLLDQVERAVREGATLFVDGERADVAALNLPGPGFFVKPGLLTNVQSGSVADQEELFGPVAAMMVVGNEDESIAVANGNSYGLGAAVFTTDREKAHKFTVALEAGSVFVNDFVRSDPRLPFGGVKNSGYGRELGSQGLMEFVNIKTVVQT